MKKLNARYICEDSYGIHEWKLMEHIDQTLCARCSDVDECVRCRLYVVVLEWLAHLLRSAKIAQPIL